MKYQKAVEEHFNETGYEEELTESNFIFPEDLFIKLSFLNFVFFFKVFSIFLRSKNKFLSQSKNHGDPPQYIIAFAVAANV